MRSSSHWPCIGHVTAAAATLVLGGCALFNAEREADLDDRPAPVSLRFNLAYATPCDQCGTVSDEYGRPLHVAPEPILTEDDVKIASVLQGAKRSMILLELTPMAAGRMDQMTAQHVGGRLAIFIDDRLVLSPLLKGAIARGKVIIDGDFSAKRAREITRGLNMRRPASVGYRP